MENRTVCTNPRDRQLIQGVLRNVALFLGATPLQLAAIAAQCSALEARRSRQIVCKGQRLPGLFAVGYRIVKPPRGGEKGEKVLRFVHAAETFGESSALLGCPAMFE